MSVTSPGRGPRALVIHGTGTGPSLVAARIARGPQTALAPPVEP